MMSNQELLVTGAAGFIASRTCEFLLEQGCRVVGVDNLNDYYDPRVKWHRLERLKRHKAFEFHALDIEDRGGVDGLFDRARFDAVVNLAARAGVRYSLENPHVYLRTNVEGTLNLLESMRRKGVGKLVLASTSSLYAGHAPPFKESNPVDHPISPYAATKRAAEVLCSTYHQLFGIDTTVVRYFTVYGPAGRPDMAIFRFIKWIDEGTPITVFGDGRQSRDFTYVDDIATGTIAALRPVGYEIINLGGGRRPCTLLEVIDGIERLLGRRAVLNEQPAHKADMLETAADITKAEEVLGWRPQVELEEGLVRCVDWYVENRSWLKDLVL
jgi:UDP-glucuronate 4-epimerase